MAALTIEEDHEFMGFPRMSSPGSKAAERAALRQETLYDCFRALDKDESGYIEFNELRAFAIHLTPAKNLDDAQDLMRFLDTDHDNRVSFDEFLELMGPVTEPLSDAEFEMHTSAILHGDRPDEALNQPRYKHKQDCRAYLTSEVVPSLRQGLLELVSAVEKQRIELAAGVMWDEDGYLPHNWLPFSPLRWLGMWMLNQGMEGTDEAQTSSKKGTTAHAWLNKNLSPEVSFADMSRHDKVALVFRHLDRDCSGQLDASELLSMSGKLHKGQDMVYAKKLLLSMDTNENGKVDFAEYAHYFLKLAEVLGDAEFDKAINKILGTKHLSYCLTRADKLRFLFHELDKDESGQIIVEEVESLAKRLDPEVTPWKIQSAMEAFDRHDPTHMDVKEFVFVLEGLVSHIKDTTILDTLIASLLEERKLGAPIAPSDPTDEVEPAELRELVKELPVAQHTLQIGTLEAMDASNPGSEAPLLWVDCRTAEEFEVSTIPGAIHCPAVKDEEAPHGWEVLPESVDKLAKHIAVTAMLPGGAAAAAAEAQRQKGRPASGNHHDDKHALRIVMFCNTGERSGANSIIMKERLNLPVRSLCGGILNYYNQGGSVCDAQGTIAQAVHPGVMSAELGLRAPEKKKRKEGSTTKRLDFSRLVTRPNTFKSGAGSNESQLLRSTMNAVSNFKRGSGGGEKVEATE